ncbi:MAG: serine/threonine protein kinase [Dokdonella sp.]|uniref:serine/threonine-protein kinase n=1 Tax=Dokdonella sp. TaxID=2291710 RepID=UPI0027BB1B24|nr:serine/threonine-protein kinase [Dokdonella sp.]MCW5577802.1 serine/threonine protein kinase [Dokdonella sp.]
MEHRDNWREVESLFDAAWEIPAAERGTWLARQAVAPAVVEEVLALLDAAGASAGFLEAPDAEAVTGTAALLPFERLGCWRLCGLLGRGGMGSVHTVERDDGQFAQRAALKLIDTIDAAAVARFHHERQVLATLDHPGIARIIDGGEAPDGRPFMVMEHVDGTPIDAYCDRHAIDLRGRVRLVQQACDALAHAHARRVVHRDVTPSNLLVDADGRTRLIDFGIAGVGGADAKAGAMSWDYAAPELAEGGVVSTSTDVYGVAAVLYRLVAGRPPRSSAGASPLVAVAGLRAGIVPLADVLAGQPCRRGERALLADLDAILARALARNPAERPDGVLALRHELERALVGDVVEARAGERLHRLVRGVHRARWWLASVAAIVLSLTVGIGVAVMHAREAAHQRDEALREQARLEAIQQAVFHMFRSAGESGGSEVRAADVLGAAARRIGDEFADDPARGAPVLHALGELYFLLTDYEAAAPLLERLAAANPDVVDPALVAAARYDLAQVAYRQGRIDDAAASLAQAQAFWLGEPVRWESRLVDSRLLESQVLRARGDTAAAIALLEAALPRRLAISGEAHRETGVLYNNLAVARFDAGDLATARNWFAEARSVWRDSGLGQSPDALNTLNNAGAVELAAGQPREAEALFEEALALRERLYGESAATAALVSNLGKLKLQGGQVEAAVRLLERAARMAERYAGKGSLHHVAALGGLTEALLARGDVAGAEAAALEASPAPADGEHAQGVAAAMSMLALARVRQAQGSSDEATQLLDRIDAEVDGLSGAAAARLRAQAAQLRASPVAPAPRPVRGTATPSP